MKKFIAGLLAGAVLFLPIGAKAWNLRQMAKPIAGVDCTVSNYEGDNNKCDIDIYVFDDLDNKCYVSKDSYGQQSSISCVKN